MSVGILLKIVLVSKSVPRSPPVTLRYLLHSGLIKITMNSQGKISIVECTVVGLTKIEGCVRHNRTEVVVRLLTAQSDIDLSNRHVNFCELAGRGGRAATYSPYPVHPQARPRTSPVEWHKENRSLLNTARGGQTTSRSTRECSLNTTRLATARLDLVQSTVRLELNKRHDSV